MYTPIKLNNRALNISMMTIVLQDRLTDAILKIVKNSSEPLETEEIVRLLQEIKRPDVSFADATRTKVLYRLNNLRADGQIAGKMLGAGKGVWIWWQKSLP